MKTNRTNFSLCCFALALSGAACAGSEGPGGGGEDAEETSPSSSSTTGGSSSGSGGDGSIKVPDKVELVYGHSPDTLYKLDPLDNSVLEVGLFANIDSDMIDIALDKDSNMYGTTFGGLYAIDRSTAECTLIAKGNYPNSLSFVPAGTVDPDEEALVGYEESKYVRIDLTTGLLTEIGGITGYRSSGDIVAVEDGSSAYLTIRDLGEGKTCQDCIVKINPKTGELIKNYGSLGYTEVFGLAFWDGSAYGFTKEGELVQIKFGNSSVETTVIPMPDTPLSLSFYGAGSTTAAPAGSPD